ncbi:MAG: hypothetical protein ACREQZ_10095 [Woeseiaceae bacterium]
MTTQLLPATAATVLRARITRLASDPRVKFILEGGSILAELADVLAQLDDLDRRQHASDQQFAKLARLVELGADPGPCS